MSVTSLGLPAPGLSPEAQSPDKIARQSTSAKGASLFAIARIGQARQALADMLVCYSRLLQSNDDVNSRLQLRTELAGLLIDKDPELLDCVLDIAGKKRKSSGPRVLELFNGLIAIAARYEAAGITEEDPAWTDLRAMAARLMATYHKRIEELLPQLKLEGLALKLVPEWLLEADRALKSATAVERLPGLLAQSPAYMLESGFSIAVDAIDELSVAGMDTEAEALTAHICSALKAYSKEDRMKSVAGLSQLIENSMDQSAKTVVQLEDALLEACARETSESVLRTFMTYLLERMVGLYNRAHYSRAERHADTLGVLDRSFRKAMGEDAPNAVRDAAAELSKSGWAQSLPQHLLEGGEKELAASRILGVIDRNLSTTLIACIGREDNLAHAQIFAKHLKQLCPGSGKTFVALMSSQNDPAMLSRMLAIAPHVGAEDDILEVVYPLLVHSNFDLRATALQYVLDHDNERTAAFVASRLRDPRSAIQREMWMGILTKLRHPSAAQVVMTELQTEIDSPLPDDHRTMTLIEACNSYDDARIAHVLVRLLRGGVGMSETRRVTALQRENGKSLKLVAMKVLIRYNHDPLVYEAFDRLRRDTDLDISRMAVYCMNPAQDQTPIPSGPAVFASGPRTATSVAQMPVSQTQAVKLPLTQTGRLPVSKTQTGKFSVSQTGRFPAPQTGAVDSLPKPRRGFEELEPQSGVDAIFQPGAAIVSQKEKRPPPQSQTGLPAMPPIDGRIQFTGKQTTLDPSQLPDDLFAGLKPLLEGELHDLGLGLTARITCAKNGVMIIKCSLGNGAIYIQNKTVVAAFFSGMSDIQALAAIGKLKHATFAYYAKSFSYAASMSVEVSNIETAIREYLDMR